MNGFSIYPAFPQTVPDMDVIVVSDSKANPADKYKLIADAPKWNTNIGHPGYLNPAISEIYRSSLVPKMFAQAMSSKMTPEEALTQADQEVRKIFDKWRALGKV